MSLHVAEVAFSRPAMVFVRWCICYVMNGNQPKLFLVPTHATQYFAVSMSINKQIFIFLLLTNARFYPIRLDFTHWVSAASLKPSFCSNQNRCVILSFDFRKLNPKWHSGTKKKRRIQKKHTHTHKLNWWCFIYIYTADTNKWTKCLMLSTDALTSSWATEAT